MADDYRPLAGSNEQKFKHYEKVRDQALGTVIDKIDVVTKKANMVQQELNDQDGMIDKANADLQKHNKQMKTLNDKMQDFLESTSNTCLYVAIAIAGFIFLLLVSI